MQQSMGILAFQESPQNVQLQLLKSMEANRMKSWHLFFLVVTILCLFPAANTMCATAGSESTQKTKMSSPLAEMLFYEAAEQAVEDGYATIIPENPEGKKADTVVDTKSEQAVHGSAPSETGPLEQKQ